MRAIGPCGLSQARGESGFEGAQAGLLGGELGEERGDRVRGHLGGAGGVSEEESEVVHLSGRTRQNKLVHLSGPTGWLGTLVRVHVGHAGPYALRGTAAG